MQKAKYFFIALYCFCYGSLFSQEAPKGIFEDNAVTLEVTSYKDFHEGYAIVQKGDDFAIINGKGAFLIPFGTYNLTDRMGVYGDRNNYDYGFYNGFCKVRDVTTGAYGMLDTTGHLFLPCQYNYISSFDKEGYCIVAKLDEQKHPIYYWMDKKKNRIAIKGSPNLIYSNGLAGTPAGYVDRKGDVKIPVTNFLYWKNFSEGLAAVCIRNDYNETLWGFIDLKGKFAIPAQFAREPDPFSNGRALLHPNNRDNFYCSYIDKTGKVVFRVFDAVFANTEGLGSSDFPGIGIKTGDRDYTNEGSFYKNFAYYRNTFFYDTTGHLFDLQKLIPLSQLDITDKRFTITAYTDNNIVASMRGTDECGEAYTIVSKDGTVLIPPVFCVLQDFDEKSGLAYAEYRFPKPGAKYVDENLVRGYINRKGKFVVILKTDY